MQMYKKRLMSSVFTGSLGDLIEVQRGFVPDRILRPMIWILIFISGLAGVSLQAQGQPYDGDSLESISASYDLTVSGTNTAESLSGQQLKQQQSEAPQVETDGFAGYAAAATGAAGSGYDQATISTWRNSNTNMLGERLRIFWDELPLAGERITSAFSLTTNPETGWTGVRVTVSIIGVFVLALMMELFTTRKLLNRLYNYANSQEKTNALKYKFITTRICIQFIGIAVLGIASYLLGLYFVKQNEYLEYLFIELLKALLQFRMWLVLIRNIFSPARIDFRPIPMEDAPARQLYSWFTLFFGIIEFGDAWNIYLGIAEVDPILTGGLLIPYTLLLNLIILVQVWRMRDKITNMFVSEEDRTNQGFVKLFLMQSWPLLFSAWMIMLWMLWLYNAFLGNWAQAIEVGKSWWITLAFPIVDRMFHGLIKQVEDIDWLQSPHYTDRAGRFIQVVQTGFRFVLAGIALYLLSQAGGFQPNSLMTETALAKVLRGSVNIAFFGVLGYVIWEMFHALIERKLPVQEVDAIASLEGDGGGAGATRAETLVPLMRTLMTVILTIFFALTVLHSLGISIGPLLAGAGVLGIAIGFGAQKLVQDVISGVFFLIDDAFRKGEYIELEGLKGTVEKISLRSMQLRHHLGAVQTIPYGEIRTVKNLSRDWITMKLELRLPYDTDIEKVRKIIKKVGQTMLEDPIMGPSFILPLKSQGVMRVEESALIFRMKFTTKPGEQWVVRREAYRNVRDALADAGIHFAHREVRVNLPELDHHPVGPSNSGKTESTTVGQQPQTAPALSNEELKQRVTQAATAAATGIIASEALKKGRLDDDDGDMDDEM